MNQTSQNSGKVSGDTLLYLQDDREIRVEIDSPDWLAWLDQAHSFSFKSEEGTFTAHKARATNKRGGWYWTAYRHRHGHTFRVYLGVSSTLTLQRLKEAARQLALRSESSNRESSHPDWPAPPSPRPSVPAQPPLLITKFHIPRLPVHHVLRLRLLKALDEGTKSRLTLVTAPAGSGKTTLLADWARTTPLPVAWLSLEEEDDDPLRFLTHLLASFTNLEAWRGRIDYPLPWMALGSSWEEIVTPFVNDLARFLTEDTVLVLDDYHFITDPAAQTALRFLIEHAPAQLHWVIGTRSDPSLPLASLRARAQIKEIRMEEMRFSSQEVQVFLHVMGLDLSPKLQKVFEQHTQGCIVGVQLLTLALRSQMRPADLLQVQPGAHPFFLKYISEEILARLPAEDRRFLMQSSFLDRLTGTLCEAVTGLPDGQERLTRFYQENLLIRPLDDAGDWFGYHPLFAEALRAQQRKLDPEAIQGIHQRASHWYQDHGDIEAACDYALRARDLPGAANLLAELIPSLIEQGKFSRLSQWLDQIPSELIEASPQLYIAMIWKQVTGKRSLEKVEELIAPLERHVQEQIQETATSWVEPQSQLTLFHALLSFFQGDYQRTIALLRDALGSLSRPETASGHFLSVLLQGILSTVYRNLGNLVTAEQILLDLVIPREVETYSPINLLAMWGLAEQYEAQGQLLKWGSIYDTIFQALGGHVEVPPLPLLIIHITRASLLYEWNRLPEAEQAVDQAQAIGRRLNLGVLSQYIDWMKARIELAQGRAEVAQQIHRPPEPSPSQTQTVKKENVNLTARSARLALAWGQPEVAWRWEETCKIHFDDALRPTSSYYLYMTLARILIVRGRLQRNATLLTQALTLLKRWRDFVGEKGFQGWFIEIQMLTPLALQAQGKTKRALSTLGSILPLAESEGYVRLFVDEGRPMMHLLAQVAAYTTASPGYIQDLQSAISPLGAEVATAKPFASQSALPEPLTGRELEILRLLASGATNQQIADRLVISPNTVKRHVKHTLAKLTVTNRTQAVARARELHLLEI